MSTKPELIMRCSVGGLQFPGRVGRTLIRIRKSAIQEAREVFHGGPLAISLVDELTARRRQDR
jgi:hypothetical protein